MNNQLPDGFKWPDEIEAHDSDNSEDQVMQTVQFSDWSGPSVNPATFPKSKASHYGMAPEIETSKLESIKNDGKQFSMQNPKESSGSWSVEVFPGWVYSIQPKSAHASGGGSDPLDVEMPEISGQKLNVKSGTPPEYPRLSVEVGDTVSLRIERDKQGVLIGPVEVVVRDPANDSTHYHPDAIPDDTGANEAYLYWDVFDVEDDGNGGIKSNPKWQDDVLLTPFLWTGENVGSGGKVLKEFKEDEDIYKFRTLKGCWGSKVEEDGDIIKIELDAENIGEDESAASATILVEKDPEADEETNCAAKAQFKAFGQGAGGDQRQINITDSGNIVRIHGNSKNASLIFVDCFGVERGRWSHEDGLSTNGGDLTITVPDCNSGGSSGP